MDRLHMMKVFAAVADAGSFAQAGRELSLSPAAVTRAVSALEADLGTVLLIRTTRSVRMTDAGRRYHADCTRILADITEADEAAAGLHGSPRGVLNITASGLFGRIYVTEIAQAFCDLHPGVTINAVFVDRVVHMQDEGIDVAIRISELPDSALTAIRVGFVRRTLYGAPSYFERYGTPNHPSNLTQHRIITSQTPPPTIDWHFNDKGQDLVVRLKPLMFLNSPDALIEAALSGWAIARSLSYQVAPLVEAGRLVTILEEYEPRPVPIHVVHLEGRRASAKVRAFVDFAVERLRANRLINPDR
jgi:DNA-binding transcriptional LysR family regulator